MKLTHIFVLGVIISMISVTPLMAVSPFKPATTASSILETYKYQMEYNRQLGAFVSYGLGGMFIITGATIYLSTDLTPTSDRMTASIVYMGYGLLFGLSGLLSQFTKGYYEQELDRFLLYSDSNSAEREQMALSTFNNMINYERMMRYIGGGVMVAGGLGISSIFFAYQQNSRPSYEFLSLGLSCIAYGVIYGFFYKGQYESLFDSYIASRTQNQMSLDMIPQADGAKLALNYTF